MDHVLLALDLSTRLTGFAFGGPRDTAPKLGSWKLPGADNLVLDDTLCVAAESVSGLIGLIRATYVVIEAPIMTFGRGDQARSAHTMGALMQLTGAVRSAVRRAKVTQLKLVGSATVRKYFLNHGRPEDPKRAVMARCVELGWTAADDNQGDAAAAWAWGMAQHFQQWRPGLGMPLFTGAAA